jgi:uncharacterized delta-60 repeat protein
MLASLLLLFPALTRAETAVEAWVQRYNGPGNGNDYAQAVAVDSSNNVIVSGYSYNGTNNDYATIQYSSAGVPLWTNCYNGPGNADDIAFAVAVDSSNNVIVMGYSASTSAYSYDYATIKYSSAGVPLWTNRYNGPHSMSVFFYTSAMAVDGNNNVIVSGSSYSGLNNDYATIKYSSAGVPLWINRYNGSGNGDDYARAVAVDRSNNVIVTGYSYGGGSSYAYATIKYSDAGLPLWTNRYSGPGGYDKAFAVAVDGSNNVIVTGYSEISVNSYTYDCATIKYSSAGAPLWINSYNEGNSAAGSAVAVDSNNNVIVTGYSGSSDHYATLKYSNAGAPLWTNCYNGPGNLGQANAVAVDSNNNVIVTGYSAGNGGDNDYATIKYSSTDVSLWINRYNGLGKGDDRPKAVVVDRSGNVIVTGSSAGSGSGYDFVTIKYVLPPVITDLTLTDGAFQIQLENPAQAPTVVVEASTNLVGWVPVFTNTTPTNVLFYTDPNASNYLWRFYRACEQW